VLAVLLIGSCHIPSVWRRARSKAIYDDVPAVLGVGSSGLVSRRRVAGRQCQRAGVYLLSPSWTLNGSGGVRRLLDGAQESPATQEATQPFGLIGISYQF